MKKISIVTALLACALRGQDIVGDWNGTLKANGAELRLVMHISKADNGGLKATLDSVDQGANGIPVNAASLQGSKLKLTLDAIQATYEGTVDSNAASIAGTWTQGSPLALEFHRGTIKTEHKAAQPSDIDGAWLGTLDLGGTKLRLVFHIVNTEDGLTATADSPDQGAAGMPVTSVKRDGSSLKLDMNPQAARFEGKIADDLKTISGTFTQGGASTSIVLAKQ